MARQRAHLLQGRYNGVFPGIDLVYYGNQRQLEYDFVVAPEAPGAPPGPRSGKRIRDSSRHADFSLAITTTPSSIDNLPAVS
jgi:hypothetical protein